MEASREAEDGDFRFFAASLKLRSRCLGAITEKTSEGFEERRSKAFGKVHFEWKS